MGEGPAVDAANHLVFPTYSDGVVWVSDQEAKQLFIDQLPDSPFLYSVETPTSGNYSFTGKGERSAATDLTLYKDADGRYLNFEFKAHAFSPKRRKVAQITKDLKKLVLEPVNGFWFHTLKAVSSKTIPHLWAVLRRELKDITTQAAGHFNAKSLTIHCCVLREQFSVETTLAVEPGGCGARWLDDLNSPAYSVKKGSLVSIMDARGWSVHRAEKEPTVATGEDH